MQDVVMFVFAGREPNMQLQLPYVRRILRDHPNVEFHIWNLARNKSDNEFIRSVDGTGIRVINDLYGANPWSRFNAVYQFYADDCFKDTLFVKTDDDVVFIDTERFGDFVDAVDQNRQSVISAQVINNGACTFLDSKLWNRYEQLRIPLLDVHKYKKYAEMCHEHTFENWREMVKQPLSLVPTADWLSINFIGYDWDMGARIANRLGKPSPRHIAGREFSPARDVMGDEGMVNTLPRLILKGMLACHLYFGPQAQQMPDSTLNSLRKRYATLSQGYLGE